MKGIDGRLKVIMNQLHAESVKLEYDGGLWRVYLSVRDPRDRYPEPVEWGRAVSARGAVREAERRVRAVVMAEIHSRKLNK